MGNTGPDIQIRKGGETDAQGIADVLDHIARERIHSTIDKAFTPEEERRYIKSLSAREAIFVAQAPTGTIVGLQSLDLWASSIQSMRHVGQLGTFLLPEWRGRGIGRELFATTAEFARKAGYRKLIIQVRYSNIRAQSFYQRAGFQLCGRLSRQVIIDGFEDDELLMELFL
jgi:L-amino acid N-acyltransferase YncA